MRNLIIYSLLTLLFFAFLPGQAQVLINEFSAANYDDVTDNNGDESDWIELYNTSASPVDISGYYLSDRESNPTKWAFPAGSIIAANGYLRVWCSKRDEKVGNNYHTNFKITQTRDNEAVVFSNDSGVIIDSNPLDVPNQKNHSWGRTPDGGPDWAVYTNPTPNGTNSTTAFEPYEATPQFDMAPGFYNGSVTVALSNPNPNTTIYYTTDGSEPDNSDQTYFTPINITETTVIRAIAYNSSSSIPPSHIETNTYFIDVDHSMYVISVAGNQLETLLTGTQIEPEGTIELFDRENGPFLSEATGEFNEHGNDSWAYPQRGIDYISRDQFGINGDLDHQIFDNKDRDAFQRLIIKGAASDNYPFEDGGCHIRDAYVQELSQRGELRVDERSFESCVMYMNGEYWGIYELREKVDDIDFTDYYYDQDRENVQFLKTWGGTWSEFGGQQSFNDWDDIHNFITTNNMADSANYTLAKSTLNMGSLIDYVILNTQIVNSDWLNWNTAWWRGLDTTGTKRKWRYTLWDMDASFGHYANFTGIPNQDPDADPCDTEEIGPGGDPQGHLDLMEALLENEDFYNDYINRWAGLNNTLFTCDNMLGLLNELISDIQDEMPNHIERWGGSETEWIDNVLDLRNFILARCQVIDEGIVDCYEVEGPYNFVVDVQPAGSGDVDIDNTIPGDYAFLAEYYGGVSIDLQALAAEGWEFSHWEVNNQLLTPSDTATSVSIDFEVADTVVAFFNPIGIPVTVEFNVPDTQGSITINDTVTTTETWTGFFNLGDTIYLSALSNNAYEFESWEYTNLTDNTIDPSPFSEDIFFIVGDSDTITANYVSIPYGITVITEGEGVVTLNGVELNASPWLGFFTFGELMEFNATPNVGYEFNQWTALNNTIVDPNNQDLIFNLASGDTIYVSFVPQVANISVNVGTAEGGSVIINDIPISGFPYSEDNPLGTPYVLSAIPDAGYVFVGWELSDATIVGDLTDETISFLLSNNLDVTAIFEPLPVANINVNIGEIEGGSITINGIPISGFPYSEENPLGTQYVLSVTPEEGYAFVGWELSIPTIVENTTDETISFDLFNNLDATAVFEILPITVTISLDENGGGSILLDGEVPDSNVIVLELEVGETIDLSAIPDAEFVLENWTINGETSTDPNISWEAIIGGADISVSFAAAYKECFVNTPTAFSPNGDGNNESFAPLTQDCTFNDYTLQVFNRWGNLVFQSTDATLGWDGSFEGKEAELGVYMWFVSYQINDENGEAIDIQDKGSVMLLK